MSAGRQFTLEVLVVDDDVAVRESVSSALVAAGHRVTEAADGARALALIVARTFDVAIFDIRLPKVDGLTLFRRLRLESPGTAAVLMTAYATVPDAVAALRSGAHDYVAKPFDPEEFVTRVVHPIAERLSLRIELERARAALVARDVGAEWIGRSPFATRALAHMDIVAQSDAPLLVRGEPGTGKRLAARMIHARSPRRDGPYVAVSCASIPRGMFDVELFGHVRGAFAGATTSHEGCLRAAHRGTLLLDDIGSIPTTTQAALVAALRDNAVTPVGAHEPLEIDARILATTSEPLEDRVSKGTFRDDLLSKLTALELDLPPLRDRRADLPLLFEYFLRRFARNVPPKVTPRAWEVISTYPFPGNVEELANVVRHALALCRGSPIEVDHLPALLLRGAEPATKPRDPTRRRSGTQRISVPDAHESTGKDRGSKRRLQ